ncbi:MAG: metal ABC transporter ATP-binding protein [Anaerolineales bacterium]|nr:metal ABC transporter ATP-binding protein [Anaerolineales bacterium]
MKKHKFLQRLSARERHHAGSPVLEVSHLNVKYGSRFVLEDITFRLERGQRIAVVGPNGAGKSTLFKVIAGVIPPSSGNVNVYGEGPGGHICIAYVPQRSQVDWHFPVSIYDVVMMGRVGALGYGRIPGTRDHQLVQQCLRTVGLTELADRQISELSGGQQQRMFIARALAQQAEIVLMDEPLNGLDLPSQEAIFSILNTLQQQKVTVLVATHDLHQAVEKFDQVILLKRNLMGFGSGEQVLTPENLMQTYGGHLHMIPIQNGFMALGDTCCDHDEV